MGFLHYFLLGCILLQRARLSVLIETIEKYFLLIGAAFVFPLPKLKKNVLYVYFCEKQFLFG